jgi:hypothetical protein
MITPDLIDYVRKSLNLGQPIEQIKQSLLNIGWGLPDIDDATRAVFQQTPPQNVNQNYQIPTGQVIRKTGWTIGKIIFLLITISFLAALIYGGIFAYRVYKVYQNNKDLISKTFLEEKSLSGLMSSFNEILNGSKKDNLSLENVVNTKEITVNNQINTFQDSVFVSCPSGWRYAETSKQVICFNDKPKEDSENFSFNKSVNVSSSEEAKNILLNINSDKGVISSEDFKELAEFASSNFGIESTVKYNSGISETEIENGQVFSVYGTASVKAEWPLTYDLTGDIATHIIVCNNGYGRYISHTSSQSISKISVKDLSKSFDCN